MEPGQSDRKSDAEERAEYWPTILRLAARIGIEPGPYTLRELMWMSDEINKDRWDRTSDLMTLLANIHSPKRARPYRRTDFHPYRANSPPPSISRAELHNLRDGLPVHYVTLPKTDAN